MQRQTGRSVTGDGPVAPLPTGWRVWLPLVGGCYMPVADEEREIGAMQIDIGPFRADATRAASLDEPRSGRGHGRRDLHQDAGQIPDGGVTSLQDGVQRPPHGPLVYQASVPRAGTSPHPTQAAG